MLNWSIDALEHTTPNTHQIFRLGAYPHRHAYITVATLLRYATASAKEAAVAAA